MTPTVIPKNGVSLSLRLFNNNDAQIVFDFNSDINNLKYVPRTPYINMVEANEHLNRFIQSINQGAAYWWVFVEPKTGKAVGYGGIFDIDHVNHKAEIGYGLLQSAWGKGYASMAVDSISNFAFDKLKLHRLYGYVHPENKASVKVLEKNGYVFEGELADYFFARGGYMNACIMARVNK